MPHTLWGGTTHLQTKCVAHPYWMGRRLANIALGVVQVLRRYWVLVLPAGPGRYASHCVHQTMVMMTSQCWRIIMSATSAPGAKQAHGVGTMSAGPYTVSVSQRIPILIREQKTGDQGCESDHHPSPLSLFLTIADYIFSVEIRIRWFFAPGGCPSTLSCFPFEDRGETYLPCIDANLENWEELCRDYACLGRVRYGESGSRARTREERPTCPSCGWTGLPRL